MEIRELFTPPIIWFLIGLGLLLLELIAPGLIIIFFGIGAWLTALGLVIFDYGLNMQLAVFVVTSVIMLLLLRNSLKRKFFTQRSMDTESYDDEFTGNLAIADTDIAPGKPGKVVFKGTTWTAESDTEITKGSSVKITGKESINLKVTSN